MARPQQNGTFIVPESASGGSASPKGKREGNKPFVLVPPSMANAEDKLEPHWTDAIDSATD